MIILTRLLAKQGRQHRDVVEAGCSKFVLRPSCPPGEVLGQIETYARHLMPHFGSAQM